MAENNAVRRKLIVIEPPMLGPDVKSLQLGVKRRLKARGLADDIPVPKHGKFTQATWFAYVEAAYVLGLREATYLQTQLGGGVCTMGAQRIVRDPTLRTSTMILRAKDRKGHQGPRYYGDLAGTGSTNSVAAPMSRILGDSWGWHPPGHDGVDLICEADATLFAICDAVVVDVRPGGWWGKGARASGGHSIADGDGIIQLECTVDVGPFKKGMHFAYGHAEKAAVRVGQRVQAGQMIGHAGFANAWHIHFMVNDGSHLKGIGDRDPMPFVKFAIEEGLK